MRTQRPHRFRTGIARLATTALMAGAALAAVPASADSGPSVAFTLRDPRITESSGLAASRIHPDVYWTHNDSGDGPYAYAIDGRTGRTLARITLRGVPARDMEAISIGPDDDVYLGDIGDNLGGTWPEVWIYRFPEPRTLTDRTVDVTRFTVRYADGPRNAESLMVDPRTGRVYIASKNEDGGGLYQGPARLSATATNVFHKIADVPWVTDGSFSPDGSRLLLRGYFGATDYRWTGGRPRQIGAVDIPLQRQGESVTYTRDGRALMVGSEGDASEVWRVPLAGADLPDSAHGASAAAATSPAASPSTSPSPGTDVKPSGRHGSYVIGIIALVIATILVSGLRKLAARSRDRGRDGGDDRDRDRDRDRADRDWR